MSWVKLENFAVSKGGSVDPAKYSNEVFDLYSIPAYDQYKPDVVAGSEIGSSKKIVQPGDVLLSRIVPHIRRVWVVGHNQSRRQIGSGEWLIFRGDSFEPNYLRHMLMADPFHQQFMKTVAGVGGSLLRARPSEVEKIKIPLPPLPKQKRIAAILDKADFIRRKRQEAVRLTEELLRSVFLDMFGDPVSNPKGFETGLLGDYCDMETGYAFKSEAFQKSGVRLCRGANVLPGELDWSDVNFWSNDSKLAERYILREGDIVLAMDRPWISTGLKVARVSNSDIPSYLVQRVARLRAIKGLSNEFIYFCIKHPYFMKHCVPKMTETTIPHISPLDIRSFPVLLPDATKVRTFSKIALKVMQTESSLLKSAHATDTLFSSLLQRAFKGLL